MQDTIVVLTVAFLKFDNMREKGSGPPTQYAGIICFKICGAVFENGCSQFGH